MLKSCLEIGYGEVRIMKFTIIFGSPRKQGNTASILAPFMDELKKNGADVDYFDVY
ncbi:NAD(P)H-dependent oxidoreductase, partial [Frisingicoccus sp.]|uniref:NAD(P)H-dependent oxidoreductase n=1 Tax=Frisingicoccus sp. TaxID=1918627 RepID=UPI0038646BA9